MSIASSARTHRQFPRTLDARVALLEAKEMLESQQLWHLQARMPPEALRALDDLQLHLRQDAEQEERVRSLSTEVQTLQQRLAALEMIVRGSMPEGNAILVAPTQQLPVPKKSKKKSKRTRVAAQ